MAMLMRVRDSGDRIVVEIDGVAGRQSLVLQALSLYRDGALRDEALAAADVSIRSSAQGMRISLRPREGMPLAADIVYRCLRHGLYAGRVLQPANPPAGRPSP